MTDALMDQKVFMRLTPGAIKVFVAIVFLGGVNVGNKHIKKMARMSLPTVRDALDVLADDGFVESTARTNGWNLTALGITTMLMGLTTLLPQGQLDLATSEKFLHSLSNINIDKEVNNSIINIKDQDINSPKPSETILHSHDDQVIVDHLHSHGIFDPTAIDLANSDHVTLELAMAFCQNIKAGILDVPLAIWQMQNGWAAPDLAPIPCPECGQVPLPELGGKIFHINECSLDQ